MPFLTIPQLVIRTRRWLASRLLPLLGLAGCSLSGLVGDAAVPTDITDPAVIKTREGALGTYYGTLQLLNQYGDQFVIESGVFSDELRPAVISPVIGNLGPNVLLDARGASEEDERNQVLGTLSFTNLHRLRGHARQSRGALRAYAPNDSRALLGHLYAVEGFVEVLLADLYCSGVQLSTVDFDGDFTIKPASTTEEIYRHAIVLFDSALALSADSLQVMDFARMGKARALGALGDYAGAQQASAEVATDFTYGLGHVSSIPPSLPVGVVLSPSTNPFHAASSSFPRGAQWTGYNVSDREGVDTSRIRGIPYASRNDPRVPVTREHDAGSVSPYAVYTTTKYTTAASPTVIANGIEARLIQAEAELAQGSGAWLVTLNALRTTCTTVASCPSPAPAGSGQVVGLPPLEDPGTDKGRVALLFEERALWLFLTGHRQGDMRRLIREYGWALDEVYPTGPYYRRNGTGVYAPFADLPIPREEQINNPLYEGCFNREA